MVDHFRIPRHSRLTPVTAETMSSAFLACNHFVFDARAFVRASGVNASKFPKPEVVLQGALPSIVCHSSIRGGRAFASTLFHRRSLFSVLEVSPPDRHSVRSRRCRAHDPVRVGPRDREGPSYSCPTSTAIRGLVQVLVSLAPLQ